MDFATLLRPHRRWHQLIVRSQDGDLATSERARLASHTATCANCAARLADSLTVATLLRGLPEREAPRSFHITSAMVAASAREPLPIGRPSGRPAFLLRGAQLVSGIAAAALVAVLVIDVSGGGGGDNDQASVELFSAKGATFENASGSNSSNSTGAPAATAAASAPTAALAAPTYDAGGGSASGGVPSPSPAPPRTGAGAEAPTARAVADGAKTADNDTQNAFGDDALSAEVREAARAEDGGDTLRIVEIGLAALLVAGLASLGWLGLARGRRS